MSQLFNLPAWWSSSNLEPRDFIFGGFGLLMLLSFPIFGFYTLRDFLQRRPLTYGDIVAPLMGLLVGSGFLFALDVGLHKRYLLATGPCRYTVATVYKHYRHKGYRNYRYHYYVLGQRNNDHKQCGIKDWKELECPPLGQRYYVRFAVEDPDAHQLLPQLAVPDTLRHIPPQGWAQLPGTRPPLAAH